jgi:outer membrane lipoprotein SlyB
MRSSMLVLAALLALALSGCATNLECDGHECAGNWKRDMALDGTVVRCADGSWSHAGGLQGACAGDGGVRRARPARTSLP